MSIQFKKSTTGKPNSTSHTSKMHTALDLGLFSEEYHRTLNKHILEYTGAEDPAQDQWIQS